MVLILPTPEVTVGPDWASQLVAALELVDAHDHTTGKGVQITPAGLNINSDLTFASYSATNLKGAVFQNDSTSDSTAGRVYRVGSDLYYNNAAGVPIQLTSGTAVNSASSGAISATTPVSYPYTVLTSDAQKVLLIDTSAARTLNLPAATNSMYVIIKDKTGTSQTNNITITPDGTDTIDGSNSSYLIRSNYSALALVSDGVASWYVV